ncbi:hypothetical protein BDZ89DRAFT_343071 [Hymenopellis radicata]|nr:hypothetical protein BDZ89DRAFT_343071 [Hymenopellis radicata]
MPCSFERLAHRRRSTRRPRLLTEMSRDTSQALLFSSYALANNVSSSACGKTVLCPPSSLPTLLVVTGQRNLDLSTQLNSGWYCFHIYRPDTRVKIQCPVLFH